MRCLRTGTSYNRATKAIATNISSSQTLCVRLGRDTLSTSPNVRTHTHTSYFHKYWQPNRQIIRWCRLNLLATTISRLIIAKCCCGRCTMAVIETVNPDVRSTAWLRILVSAIIPLIRMQPCTWYINAQRMKRQWLAGGWLVLGPPIPFSCFSARRKATFIRLPHRSPFQC